MRGNESKERTVCKNMTRLFAVKVAARNILLVVAAIYHVVKSGILIHERRNKTSLVALDPDAKA